MKRLAYTLISSMMAVLLISFSAFAAPYDSSVYTSPNIVSSLLAPGVRQSKVTKEAITRGNFFSSADLIISNDGGGNVGALAVGYMRYPVDEAYITLYLDRFDEESQRWRQVNSYEAEFYAKDYPDGLLTPTVSITFTKQPKGKYYRLRSSFSARSGGAIEGFSPTTDGILLD